MTTVPITLAAGEVIDADDLNTNFSALATAIDALTTENLEDDARITSRQMADRYHIYAIPLQIVPVTTGTSFAALGEFTTPASDTEVLKHTIRIPSSRVAHLAYVEIYCAAMTTVSSSNPTVTVLINAEVVGGSAVELDTDDAYYPIGNADPINSPMMPVQNGDDIIIKLGRSDAGAATVRGVSVMLWIKAEHTV